MRIFEKYSLFGLVLTVCTVVSTAAHAGTAKVSDFILIHSEATIKSSVTYTNLNKLSDTDLKKTVQTPQNGDYITVKAGTKSLRDGNTRVYLLKQRGFGALVVTYDEVDTGYKFYDD